MGDDLIIGGIDLAQCVNEDGLRFCRQNSHIVLLDVEAKILEKLACLILVGGLDALQIKRTEIG